MCTFLLPPHYVIFKFVFADDEDDSAFDFSDFEDFLDRFNTSNPSQGVMSRHESYNGPSDAMVDKFRHDLLLIVGKYIEAQPKYNPFFSLGIHTLS